MEANAILCKANCHCHAFFAGRIICLSSEMTYKLWIRCLKGNTLIQQAVPVLWCCTGVGWLTLPSANVLPFCGLDKCVQMPVVGKQQLYNGFAQAEWFREQWEAGNAAKSVQTAFQRERVAGREGKLVCGKGCQCFTGNVFNVS